jgi:hypothetical protein
VEGGRILRQPGDLPGRRRARLTAGCQSVADRILPVTIDGFRAG